jgi:hypothetical protein
LASAVSHPLFRRCGAVFDAQIAWPTFTLSPAFTFTFFHLSGNRGRHLDGRLVGFELDHRLVFLEHVAWLDQDAQHVAGGDVLADSGRVKSVNVTSQDTERIKGHERWHR